MFKKCDWLKLKQEKLEGEPGLGFRPNDGMKSTFNISFFKYDICRKVHKVLKTDLKPINVNVHKVILMHWKIECNFF